MSYRQQYADRVRQALATDARTAGTTIDGLPLEQCYDVAREIASLYPYAGTLSATYAVHAARSDAREAREAV